MKNRKNSIIGMAVALAVTFIFYSCQKEEIDTQQIPESSVQLSEDGNDQNEVTDEAVDIVMDAFENFDNLRKLENDTDSCNNIVAQINSANKITFTFMGDNCAHTRTRAGEIIAELISDVKWHEAGGTLEITFNDFKVTRKSDNKSITINGKYVAYNVSGIANPFIHTLHGNMTVKFDNGSERDWIVSRRRTITLDGNVVQVKVESDSVNFVTEMGVNREGMEFVTTIPDPIVVQNCSVGPEGYKFITGEIVYAVGDAALSIDFGYTSLSEKTDDCEATGSVLTYTDPSTVVRKYYPYKE
ncbi:MAG TPA: hypothetical protein VD908_00780 [Cytophagales bacterium]|nr:hypothetical protein [Cytophagales bacterium]